MTPTAVWLSVLARPLTTLYVLGSLILIAATAGWVDRNLAIALETFIFAILIVLGLHRENAITAEKTSEQLTEIHVMVNSQHDELVAHNGRLETRVDQLVEALQSANVLVPDAAAKEKGSRS